MSDHLTYAQVADRIEAALGERPALTTLRDAVSRSDSLPAPLSRITAGMPVPTPGDPGSPSLFKASEVDAWLAGHPRREWPELLAAIAQTDHSSRGSAVINARAAGISWQAIADTINATDGTNFTRQWAQQKYSRGAS